MSKTQPITKAMMEKVAAEQAKEPIKGWEAPVAPDAWTTVSRTPDGASYRNYTSKLTCILSGAAEEDGKRWVHLSIAHARRQPSYQELAIAKVKFLGAEAMAFQVFAPKSQHVNIHANALHLWHCLDGNPLPDFTRGTGSI